MRSWFSSARWEREEEEIFPPFSFLSSFLSNLPSTSSRSVGGGEREKEVWENDVRPDGSVSFLFCIFSEMGEREEREGVVIHFRAAPSSSPSSVVCPRGLSDDFGCLLVCSTSDALFLFLLPFGPRLLVSHIANHILGGGREG